MYFLGIFYKDGMKVAILDSLHKEKGWHRGCDYIQYSKSSIL